MVELASATSVRAAFKRIEPHINNTPLITSSGLNDLVNAKLFLKCENMQKTGSFKARGATNAILSLKENQYRGAVITQSSGNHGAALAYAAGLQDLQAHIVMPSNSNEIKIKAVKDYGGKIYFCEPTTEAREQMLIKIKEKTNGVVVHPYNDPVVISGQGTIGIEIFQQEPDLDFILAPVGGGGLISGISLISNSLSPITKIIGCEPEAANDAFLSIQQGKIMPSKDTITVADGLRTSLGTLTFQIIKSNVSEIITVSEAEIIQAMRLSWQQTKLIIEPSSATSIAAVIKGQTQFKGKRIGIILSGGNVDLDHLPWEKT